MQKGRGGGVTLGLCPTIVAGKLGTTAGLGQAVGPWGLTMT